VERVIETQEPHPTHPSQSKLKTLMVIEFLLKDKISKV
jgi:hypothetical protein